MNNEYRDIVSFDGTLLKCLVRETGSSNWLIVTHGLGEHLGRHEYILKLFSQSFNIAIYDLRGHGRSGGKRGFVEDFQDYLMDLQAVISFLRKDFSMTKYNLFGHSMGGLITAAYLQNTAAKDFYPEKVFLSSPAVGAGGVLGPVMAAAPMFVFDALRRCPTIPLKGVLNLRRLSHDSRVYESYIKDEFNVKKVHSKLFWELLKMSRDVFSRPLRAECPLFCSIGSDDGLVHPQLMIKYFTTVEKNAQLKVFEGGYHELHNEVEKYRKPYLNYLRQSLTGLAYEGL
ncbi:MAG TPA: alpha/beta fold hydrolase [Bacteriovoracaceae bacterium]|nr:alpha/beta fold hydrolase [Bacteriovoracaceae bacterium]